MSMRLHSRDGELRLNVENLTGPRFPTGATSPNKGIFEAADMTVMVTVHENLWRVHAVNLSGPMVLADGVGLAAKKRGQLLRFFPLDPTDPLLTPEQTKQVEELVAEAMGSWLPGGHLRFVEVVEPDEE